jgi:hypothetical protein
MKEEEIRPKAVFDEYLRLADIDTQAYFTDGSRVHINCPACRDVGDHAFEKSGFSYDQCPSCKTLYVNPRPLAEAFSKYYQEAPSVEFWATTFYKETAEARREKLWKPKAEKIKNIINSFCETVDPVVVDIGGGYGIFAEEISSILKTNPIIIEPGPYLAKICRDKGFKVVEKFLEDVKLDDLPSHPKAFVSFELFEHLHDPLNFMEVLFSIMSSGDIFVFTTLSGTGVDIQALWENSKSVMPPHHLNFFNPSSAKNLAEHTGFECLQTSTPGELDIDILDNNRSLIKDRFWKTLVEMSTREEKEVWQKWIVEQGYSSHMWVVCRKP